MIVNLIPIFFLIQKYLLMYLIISLILNLHFKEFYHTFPLYIGIAMHFSNDCFITIKFLYFPQSMDPKIFIDFIILFKFVFLTIFNFIQMNNIFIILLFCIL